jgi:hypothetical protein
MDPSLRLVWEHVGRQATVDNFRAHGERMEDAAEWLEKHCVLCWKEERFQCVRAGLRKERIEVSAESFCLLSAPQAQLITDN